MTMYTEQFNKFAYQICLKQTLKYKPLQIMGPRSAASTLHRSLPEILIPYNE